MWIRREPPCALDQFQPASHGKCHPFSSLIPRLKKCPKPLPQCETPGGSLTLGVDFAPIPLVKPVLPARLYTLIALVCALVACKTTSDRFDLYSPDKPQGPATQKLRGMTLAGRYDHQSNTFTYPVTGSVGGVPPEESGPIAPPPPLPPAESGIGAPAPTPLPAAIPAAPLPNAVPMPGATTPSIPATPGAPSGGVVIPGLNGPTTTVPPPAPAPAATPAPPAAPAGTPLPPIPGLSQ